MPTQKVVNVVWARAGGRCQYPGCNQEQIGDLISGAEDAKFGFIAHIVAEAPGGPRGDPVRSPLLADDPANLMLLCGKHHKLIDIDELDSHPEELLINYKKLHEDRINLVTAIAADRASHVLLYGAKVGNHSPLVNYTNAALAMVPDFYPAERQPIEIHITGSVDRDKDPAYWSTEVRALRQAFAERIRPRVDRQDIRHLSVFAIAPMPLLVELGRLLGDITPVQVYQLAREPVPSWNWAKDNVLAAFHTAREPGKDANSRKAALLLGLSATVAKSRVTAVLGENVPIFSISTPAPNRDIIRTPRDLSEFRALVRRTLDEIKATCPGGEIHVFPAAPVSTMIEVGRVWMPKGDLPMVLYDETPGQGFVVRHRIDHVD